MRIANFSLMFSDLRAGRSSTTVEILPAGILGVEISPYRGSSIRIWIWVLYGEPSLARTTAGFAIFQAIIFKGRAVRDVSIPPGTRLLIVEHIQRTPKLNGQTRK
ncbi:Uncharacterized protein Rs2_48803 [Raphanus sativus]|nr:Uncharacterized protein Rs2_48803 [Raphanus sativus]